MTLHVPKGWSGDTALQGTFAEDRMAHAARSFGSWRFNPHHGADGKFASADGFKAGAWKDVGGQRIYDDLKKSFTDQGISEADAADMAARSMRPMGQALENGNVMVVADTNALADWGVEKLEDSSEGKQLLSSIDDMQTRFPIKGPVTIRVMTNNNFPQVPGQITQGETAKLGEGKMRFNSTGLADANNPKSSWASGAEYHSPAYAEVGPIRYTVAHEWGHAIDTDSRDAQRRLWSKTLDEKTQTSYGQTNEFEGYAEAFAGYALGEKSELTIAYNNKFGWDKRFPNGGSK